MVRGDSAGRLRRRAARNPRANAPRKNRKVRKQRSGNRWDAKRIKRLLAHYEKLSEDEQTAEDEEAARRQDA